MYNSELPTLQQQFGDGTFLFQHDNAIRYRARPIKNNFITLVWKNFTGQQRAQPHLTLF